MIPGRDLKNDGASGAFISYAQNFEDVVLWRVLADIKKGTYIDIGAQDATVDSVSRAFHERGWVGVHVEPVAAYANSLRTARGGDKVIEAVVGRGTSSILYEIPGTGLSTTMDDVARRHAASGFEVQALQVSMVTLHEVLACAPGGDIHWLKIDVEGAENEVIASWGESDRRPWVVLVESTSPLSDKTTTLDWEPDLIARGYQFALFDGLNRFYVADTHLDLLPRFRCGANVFDDFSLSGLSSEPFTRLLRQRLDSERREALEESSALRATIARLETENRKQGATLASVRRDAISARSERDAAKSEMASVYQSTSWRITAPLRASRRLMVGSGGPRRLVRAQIIKGMQFSLSRPSIKGPVMRVLRRFPKLLVWLQRIAVRAGLASHMGAFESVRGRLSAHLSNGSLSPKASKVLDELLSAIKERNS